MLFKFHNKLCPIGKTFTLEEDAKFLNIFSIEDLLKFHLKYKYKAFIFFDLQIILKGLIIGPNS